MTHTDPRPWLLLHYRLPSTPTALRVAAWRKLKRMDAVLVHDCIWVLPATPQARERFGRLAAEILAHGHEAIVWEATFALPGQEHQMALRFLEPAAAPLP